jgi:hypothetical protein
MLATCMVFTPHHSLTGWRLSAWLVADVAQHPVAQLVPGD